MRALLLMAAVALVATAAAAQAPEQFEPEFTSGPAGPSSDMYPLGALEHGSEGQALLCCRPHNGNGRSLDCRLVWEAPEGMGFGAAALRFSHHRRRLTEAARDQYLRVMPGREFPMVVTFAIRQFDGNMPPAPTVEEAYRMCSVSVRSAALQSSARDFSAPMEL